MKKLRTILVLIGVLVTGCVFNVSAQKKKPENTSSARAAYGVARVANNRGKVMKNYTHTKRAQGTNSKGLTVRKKYVRIDKDHLKSLEGRS
jgi:hypothetical protein